jgi:RimJ/RimL family protein N-acetyltransferase
MELQAAPGILVRDMALADAAGLARHADDPAVAAGLRDRFPHPYGVEDAVAYITAVHLGAGESAFTIAVDGEPAGVIGFFPGVDVYRHSAEIGYWLGRAFWGRGVMTLVLRAFVAWLARERDFVRLYAGTFSSNPASGRVLEKCGFTREAVLRKHVFKLGEWHDEIVYALLLEGEDA